MKGVFVIGLAVVIVFIASFTIFYVVDSLNKLAEECKQVKLEICEKLSGFTLQMMIVLILLGGFITIIISVGYIIFSALSR